MLAFLPERIVEGCENRPGVPRIWCRNYNWGNELPLVGYKLPSYILATLGPVGRLKIFPAENAHLNFVKVMKRFSMNHPPVDVLAER